MEQADDLAFLKRKSSRVTQFDDELARLVEDMFETMREANGVGVSAVQVGVLRRVVAMEIPGEYEEQEDGTLVETAPPRPYVLVNPEIIKMSDERSPMFEGCLSLPGRFADVPRAPSLVVKFRDLAGKEHRLRADEELLSQCIQHEVDHLDGVLFTTRIVDLESFRDERDKPRRSRFRLPRREEAAGEVLTRPSGAASG